MVASGDVEGLGLALESPEGEVSAEAMRSGAAEHARLTGVAGRFPRPEKGQEAIHFDGEVIHDLRVDAAGTLIIKTRASVCFIVVSTVLILLDPHFQG